MISGARMKQIVAPTAIAMIDTKSRLRSSVRCSTTVMRPSVSPDRRGTGRDQAGSAGSGPEPRSGAGGGSQEGRRRQRRRRLGPVAPGGGGWASGWRTSGVSLGGSIGTGSPPGGSADDRVGGVVGGGGVCAGRVEVGHRAADLAAEVLLHAPELAEGLAGLARHVGHLVGTEHQQRDHQDHEDLGRAERGHASGVPFAGLTRRQPNPSCRARSGRGCVCRSRC